ncbi:methyl-accepting chemotaxis protein [Azospirillum halopraeferens]|uniref:methyl-accepting chemotaxis protein n=1 Tax=Azospirillum halopraeferens TaxID=34010 RepID=UPI00041AC6EF|nr:methyl-accepting chemotaxis protein [Azospirillum halopraeferens]
MRLTVAQKLALAFVLVSAFALAPIAYQFRQFEHAFTIIRVIATDDVGAAELLQEITTSQALLRGRRDAAFMEAVMARSEGRPVDVAPLRQGYDAIANRDLETLQELIRLTDAQARDPASHARGVVWQEFSSFARDLDRGMREAMALGQRIFVLLDDGRLDEAIALRPSLNAMRDAMDSRMDQANSLLGRLTAAGRERIAEIHEEMVRSALLATVGLLAAALAIAFLIGRSITGRLGRAIAAVRQIGEGDLTRRVAITGNDELAALGGHLNSMAEGLRSISQGVRGAAENVHAATAQIRASTQQQAASVAEQLAAVEETMATLSEITASGAQISKRAQDVAAGAQNASASSNSGLKAVDDTIQAMDAIREQAETVAETIVMLSERTQAISDIIVTVNDIAERSHLLALNAAIEAAAAGEHGRTFSVVAAEIKSLADQAKDATAQVRSNLSEIQQGINASVMLTEEAVKRVAAGKRQSDATQSTIRQMADNIQESVLAFQQIVAGTNQQQIGLEQVIQALQNIRQASTQTAAGTRQLEGAAANLNDLGQGLVEAVRNYRV